MQHPFGVGSIVGSTDGVSVGGKHSVGSYVAIHSQLPSASLHDRIVSNILQKVNVIGVVPIQHPIPCVGDGDGNVVGHNKLQS